MKVDMTPKPVLTRQWRNVTALMAAAATLVGAANKAPAADAPTKSASATSSTNTTFVARPETWGPAITNAANVHRAALEARSTPIDERIKAAAQKIRAKHPDKTDDQILKEEYTEGTQAKVNIARVFKEFPRIPIK
jgi:hypothetical protein